MLQRSSWFILQLSPIQLVCPRDGRPPQTEAPSLQGQGKRLESAPVQQPPNSAKFDGGQSGLSAVYAIRFLLLSFRLSMHMYS